MPFTNSKFQAPSSMGKSGKPAIIVVLGSRTEGEKFVGAVKKANRGSDKPLQLVKCYSQKPDAILQVLKFAALLEIERRVRLEIKNCGEIDAILFMEARDDSTTFPFKYNSRFLDLSGKKLFDKVTVVLQSGRHDLAVRWRGWESRLRFSVLDGEPYALLGRILSNRNATKLIDDTWDRFPHPTVNIYELYQEEARSCRRDANQAVILLAGQSRHGKSKTINRLVGRKVLRMGQDTFGSTTKAIQRVIVQNTSDDTSAPISLVFDDSPGLEDTTYEDQQINKCLMRRYKQKYFQNIYPNVILLVASWDSITPDAHNDPPHFTSAAGKTMYNLYQSDLVDNGRVNVVVVVTKCMSFMGQLDDFKSNREKFKRWNIEAGRRMAIIAELQRKIFPKSAPWETVFIENGGGTDMSAKVPQLPNGQTSHQNLYDAIQNLVNRRGPLECRDLVGIHALQVLSGAERLREVKKETLLQPSTKDSEDAGEAQTMTPAPHRPSVEDRTRGLAKRYLGVTCNHVTGRFGRSSVLSGGKDSLISWSDREEETFVEVDEKSAHQNIRAQYASSSAFESALTKRSLCYNLYHITAVVTAATPNQLTLSEEMKEIIDILPRWSEDSEAKEEYMTFFDSYGTHVVTKLALGGVIRVVKDLISREKALAYGDHKMEVATSGRTTHKRSVLIFLDGGSTVAGEVSDFLENNFPPFRDDEDWKQLLAKWREIAKKDPVFCPDHKNTEYKPIYEVSGLLENQKGDLKEAYEAYQKYMASISEKGTKEDTEPMPLMSVPMSRKSNLKRAVKLLHDAVNDAFSRLLGQKRAKRIVNIL